jgi:hypothetical protein
MMMNVFERMQKEAVTGPVQCMGKIIKCNMKCNTIERHNRIFAFWTLLR